VSDVSELYETDAQVVKPTTIVLDKSTSPKLNPLTVTLPPAVLGALNAVT
jgi:hypothetical protein